MATAQPPQQALDVGSAQDGRASSSSSSSGSVSGSGGNGASSSNLTRNGSSRKAQKRGHPSDATNGDGQHSVTTGSSQSGPPYICGTCQTSYSRLEYLRRHERRHADIRPFACDCGKSFSRSDVLSRHKRQCAVALGGELPEPPAAAAPAKEPKPRKSGTSTPSRSRKASTTDKPARSSVSGQRRSDSQPGGPPPFDGQRASPMAEGGPVDGRPGSQAMAATSSGFGPPPPHLNHHHAAVAAGSIVPPPPYGGGEIGFEGGRPPPHMGAPGGFGLPGMPQPVHAQVSALNAYAQHSAYPSSPESSGSINNGSQHSSPRFGARDMARTGSGRFSLRKGGSFNLPQEFWDQASSDASKASPGGPSGRHGSLSLSSRAAASATANASAGLSLPWAGAGGASNGSAYAYSSANEFGGNTTAGNANGSAIRGGLDGPAPNASSSSQTASASGSASNPLNHLGTLPPRGDPQRFSIASGPLSPFSSIALNSTMSPYLSAFSNARDTPLVSSPNRTGGMPGTLTPGGSSASLNVFDWTMRPPVKTPTGGAATHSSGAATTTSTSSARRASNAAAQGTKRKREGEEDGAGSSPTPGFRGDKGSIDIDSKSAAELLDSLRTAGVAPRGSAPSATSTSISPKGEQSAAPSSTTGLRGGAAGSTADDASSVAGTASVRALHSSNGSGPGTPGAGGTGAAVTSRPASESAAATTASVEADGLPASSGPSAEAFLLRSTGGLQEARAGLATAPSTSYETAPGVASALAITPSSVWDPVNFGLPTPTGGAMNSSLAMGWLLSPSIQQLITTFNGGALPGSGPGDGGSYFAGAIHPSSSEGGGNSLPMGMTPAGISTTDGVLATPAVLKNYSTDFPFTPFLQGGGDTPSMNAFMTAAGATGLQTSPPKAQIQATENQSAQQDQHMGSNGYEASSPIGNIALEKALTDVQNPFYIPPQMFRACYSVSHWTLPPITRLSMLALHAQSNLLKHMPILHEPTFRLDTTPGCLAFAICMLGCHEAGRRWWAGEEIAPRPQGLPSLKSGDEAPDGRGKVDLDELDGQPLVKPLVMTEKMNYLMKSFASSVKTEKDQVSVVQALMLFQSNNFLSSDPGIRSIAAASHGAVVALARKAGFYNPGATHSQREIKYSPADVVNTTLSEASELSYAYSFLPNYLPSCPDEEKLWRRWCDLAGRRRTAFLIMIMDTVASLDAGLPTELTLEEVAHLPLPSPDTIWRAPSAAQWRKALEQYRGPTFGESISDLLCNHDDEANGGAPARHNPYGVPIFGKHGPFARLVMVVALLRGIIHLVDGRTRQVSKPSPLQPWLRNIAFRDSKGAGGDTDSDAEAAVYHRALNRWRRAWDDDELCRPKPNGGAFSTDPAHVVFTPRTASGATPLCDDALPFYWLCRVLLQHAAPELLKAETPNRTVPQALVAALGTGSSVDGRRNSSETSPDFRTLLRLAKAFVNEGETNVARPPKGADGGRNGLDSLATVAASA